MNSFEELGLAAPILSALAKEAHSQPTAIQAQAIPTILSGRDLIGIAQTGTGKTAAFTLPILNRLINSPQRIAPRHCRALILTPTRELASQINERVVAYGRHFRPTTAIVIGGQSIRAQAKTLARGVDVLIATPGRLIDLLGSGFVELDAVEVLVLDEADRMLDMGFIRPIRDISAKLPRSRQNLFFTATMPKAISGLAKSLLTDPVTVSVAPVSSTAERIEQRILHVEHGRKTPALNAVLSADDVSRALVFARTKRGADRIVRNLTAGGIHAQAIHGDKSQGQRERALAGFRNGRTRVLVATDIAARGIDVPGVSHVVNYDIPAESESYVHRIGRTARAGAGGVAISLCTGEDRGNLRSIEKLIRQTIPVMTIDIPDMPKGARPAAPAEDRSEPWDPTKPKKKRNRPHRAANDSGSPKKSAPMRRRRRRSKPAAAAA